MKKLLALLLLFGIVGCEKEPSLLEKCMKTNINLFETTTTGDDLKIVFQPDFNLFIEYSLSAWREDNKNWCFFDFVEKNECKNLEPEIFFSKYMDALYAHEKDSSEKFTVKEIKDILATPIPPDIEDNGLWTKLYNEVLKDTFKTNALLKCSEQGIY